MRYIDSYRIARMNLFRSRSRSFLTIFGVSVGVGAIVLLVSLGIGLQQITVAQVANIDVLMTLNVVKTEDSNLVLSDSAVDGFKQMKKVDQVSPSLKSAGQITFNKTTTSSVMMAINPQNSQIEGIKLVNGRMFGDGTKEIIISKSLLKTLGEDNPDNALGKQVELKIILEDEKTELGIRELKEDYTIVGIDESESMAVAYLTLSHFKDASKIENYDLVKIKVKSRGDVESVKKEIENIGYKVSTLSDLIKQIDNVFLVLEIILGSIGAIGLFVAAIGIINTMTIALLERTHEIGIMKAVGASNKDVRRLFINESLMIAGIGAGVGILFAYGIGAAIDLLLNTLIRINGGGMTMNLFITPLFFTAVMFIFTLLIGYLTGLYPARRAAKLSPLEALHIE
jgi:putative ABC transport system permease protein